MNYIGMQVQVGVVIDNAAVLVWSTILAVQPSKEQGVDVITKDGTVQYCFPVMLETAVRDAHWGGTRWALENVGTN